MIQRTSCQASKRQQNVKGWPHLHAIYTRRDSTRVYVGSYYVALSCRALCRARTRRYGRGNEQTHTARRGAARARALAASCQSQAIMA